MKKISLVCIAKNEELYLKEWVEYHIKLGFDDIHIYQNNWRFNGKLNYDNVFLHEYDGNSYGYNPPSSDPIWVKNIQARCYSDFAKKYTDVYNWVAYFDVDEFLVLKKHNNVKEFITEYDEFNCLVINWAMFGDSGIKEFNINNTSVLERFVMRKNEPHFQFKSICKLKSSYKHEIHLPFEHNNGLEYWVDPNFNNGKGHINNHANFEVAQLNHYFTKTFPEFINKIERGNACFGERPLTDFNENNYNEIYDYSAFNFFFNK